MVLEVVGYRMSMRRYRCLMRTILDFRFFSLDHAPSEGLDGRVNWRVLAVEINKKFQTSNDLRSGNPSAVSRGGFSVCKISFNSWRVFTSTTRLQHYENITFVCRNHQPYAFCRNF